jgi:hypothetical protein
MLSFSPVISFLAFHYTVTSALYSQQPLLPDLFEHRFEINGPSQKNARANANHIFKSLHSSMRQWGSSIHHNGMSFFPASVPKGSIFYHGTNSPERVTGMNWLAFEIEHAELFTTDQKLPGTKHLPRQSAGMGKMSPDPDHKYLHTYRTKKTHDRLLYIDGMSAAKSAMGTLDTQDFIIRNTSTDRRPKYDDERARDLCNLTQQWGVEGFVRMEAGFEIILCDFMNGIELLHLDQRALPDTREGEDSMIVFEYIRGASTRYHGVPSGHIDIDHSSMVSAYFYDVNLTNPDISATELPRLISTDSKILAKIRSDLQDMLENRYSSTKTKVGRRIDWQSISDMIVSRYSTRLMFLTLEATTRSRFQAELNTLTNTFIDYSTKGANITASVKKCQNHYLASVIPETMADYLIHTAILTITGAICNTLFDARYLLLSDKNMEPYETNEAFKAARQSIEDLVAWLDWSTWRDCGKCAYNEVCFIAMWPIG